ncbi:MAG: DUF91 domain-containing protein [Anaerolineales bacterium]|nr:DUF91 domain-containing protein [Anaerolineales bacterium]
MGDIKLFTRSGQSLIEVQSESYPIEKSLQTIIEKNLEVLFGIRFLASEYSTGKTHGGRIDTLGLDENNSPVILEYKRAANENVINQGLYYLDWLLDHKAEYQLLVSNMFGSQEASKIEWATARLICIANQFFKYDEYAVKQISRNIELFQYKKFNNDLFLLELVNSTTGQALDEGRQGINKASRSTATFQTKLEKLSPEQANWYEEIKTFTTNLGDDVKVKQLKLYTAFSRIKNFLCVEVHPQSKKVVLFLKLNPLSYTMEPGFSRDVSNIGHYGTGDLEITISSREDISKAEPFISQAYEQN